MSTQAPEQDEQQDSYLDFSQLSWLEAVGMVSGALLFISLFLPWFSTGSNPDSDIATAHIGPNASATAFQTGQGEAQRLVLADDDLRKLLAARRRAGARS